MKVSSRSRSSAAARPARLIICAALALVGVLGTASSTASAEAAPPRTVHGSTAASAYWWQQGPADCAPMAARALVGAVTGVVVPAAAMDAVAARVAGYDADGTDWSLTPALLAAYGVPAHLVDGATLDDVRTALDTAGPVLVVENAETVWNTSPDLTHSAPDGTANHAVVLEQVDDAAHTVTLVDSGWPGGRHFTVPTPVFLEAWAAGGNSAVVPLAVR